MSHDLTHSSLRTQITEIDHEILSLLTRRMEISREIAEYKMAAWLPVYDPVRERDMIERYSDRVDFDISKIYSEIMAESKRLQNLRIGQL